MSINYFITCRLFQKNMTILEIASLFSKLSSDNETIILEQLFFDDGFIFYVSIDTYSIDTKTKQVFVNDEEVK